MGTVLVVDDERSLREFLAICLKRAGHVVTIAETGDQAITALDGDPVDIVITDLRMPGDTDGLGVLAAVKSAWPDTEVIVMTAFASTDTAIAAMKVGAYDYLTKPFKVDEINAVVQRAIEKRDLVQANLALREKVAGRYRLASLLGRSPQMQRVFEMIGKIHSTRTSVLITGESGTGKELVARALHTEGSRATHPFVAVNCGAIPGELLESELFGHVKGSFTGAVSEKSGLFAEAHGGTLFLDEIGELPLGLQVKLLRVLQERAVKKVGAVDETAIDVRVIAATNRDLEQEVASGAFRSDLYYRLNVIEIRLPPLRHRREDLSLLTDHFVRQFSSEQSSKRIRGVAPAAMRVLETYDYPGNVRELENIIEHAVTLATGPDIEVDDLPRMRPSPALGAADATDVDIPEHGIDLDSVVADYERAIVQKALASAGGVRKKAARLLGISFRSLRYRIAKLGLDPESKKPAE